MLLVYELDDNLKPIKNYYIGDSEEVKKSHGSSGQSRQGKKIKGQAMKKLIKLMNKRHTPFAFKISGNVIRTEENVSVHEVANILKRNKIGAVIVERKGNLAGIISERDIVWKVVALGKSIDKTKAKDIMTRNVVTVDLKKGVNALYETLKKFSLRHLPVTNGKKVVGMVSSRDLMYLRKLKARR